MVKLIVGKKGTGKTKTLLQLVNDAAGKSKGNVICIEKGGALKFDLNYHIRLIDIEEYNVKGTEAYFGFIAGLLAGNYDITDIFGDATLKILCGKENQDTEVLAKFVEDIDKLVGDQALKVTFTVSADASELPERLGKYIV